MACFVTIKGVFSESSASRRAAAHQPSHVRARPSADLLLPATPTDTRHTRHTHTARDHTPGDTPPSRVSTSGDLLRSLRFFLRCRRLPSVHHRSPGGRSAGVDVGTNEHAITRNVLIVQTTGKSVSELPFALRLLRFFQISSAQESAAPGRASPRPLPSEGRAERFVLNCIHPGRATGICRIVPVVSIYNTSFEAQHSPFSLCGPATTRRRPSDDASTPSTPAPTSRAITHDHNRSHTRSHVARPRRPFGHVATRPRHRPQTTPRNHHIRPSGGPRAGELESWRVGELES